jgi:1,4-dihydroxy-6-naphthoate synthase
MAGAILKLGHSPDSDDAFMFYALAKGLIDTEGLAFEHILRDIETLNQWSLEGRLEITAVSFASYTRIWRDYVILSSGASVGDGYGPMVIARGPISIDQLKKNLIAIPGELTTAFLALRLALGPFRTIIMPFNKIMQAVESGECTAGLIIHEGQLTYSQQDFCCVLDLGKWWLSETGLPLPLGCNVVRRDLGPAKMAAISRVLRRSIDYSLAHRSEALAYALDFTPHLDKKLGDRFVSMYVNDLTLELGSRGRAAVTELLTRSARAGFSDWRPGQAIDFV